MAIVTLKKLTLCGVLADKSAILEQLQTLGGTHLIALSDTSIKSEAATARDVDDALTALKYLQQCANQRHQVRQAGEFDFNNIVNDVLQVKISWLTY